MTRTSTPSVAVRTVLGGLRAEDESRPATASTNIVLIGPPGAGKGTQAARLAHALGVPAISTGDMLRRAVQSGSTLGLAVKAALDRGELIDDAMMTKIVAARLGEPDTRSGFVLDGFPRTVDQAIALDRLVEQRGDLIAVELATSENAIIRRLSQRRVCERCGRNAEPGSSHAAAVEMATRPAYPSICGCGGALRRRSDDTEAVIRERLRTYERATKPLVDFYCRRRALRAIDGTQAPELVTAQISQVINALLDRAAS